MAVLKVVTVTLLITTVVFQLTIADGDRKVDCRRIVFHPYCRGISAKRALSLPMQMLRHESVYMGHMQNGPTGQPRRQMLPHRQQRILTHHSNIPYSRHMPHQPILVPPYNLSYETHNNRF